LPYLKKKGLVFHQTIAVIFQKKINNEIIQKNIKVYWHSSVGAPDLRFILPL